MPTKTNPRITPHTSHLQIFMNKQRINEILNHRQISEIFYNEKPVWIQEVHDDIAKIGFLDGSQEKDVYIEDLYESDLYGGNK